MPTYDYHCDHCGHRFSAARSFTDDSLPECPKCGKEPRKLFVPPTIVFKGSGWYKTDSRKESSAVVDSKADAKSEVKADTKSDAKKDASTTTSEKKSDTTAAGDKAGSGSSSA